MMITDTDITNQIYDAVAKLVSVYADGGSVVVSLPVAYPSGSFVGVRIDVRGDRFIVSDGGMGWGEAVAAGAEDFYLGCAKAAAEWYGIEYDGANLRVPPVDVSRISGAVTIAANASVMAASRSIAKAMEAKERSKNQELFGIVTSVFGAPNVVKTAEVIGRDASWNVHNLVQIGRERAVFEFVSKHPNSLANAYMKFSDISKADDPPTLVSVVAALASIGTKGNMLSDVSGVIELRADASMYRQYATGHYGGIQ